MLRAHLFHPRLSTAAFSEDDDPFAAHNIAVEHDVMSTGEGAGRYSFDRVIRKRMT
jgi:hypothetical protein